MTGRLTLIGGGRAGRSLGTALVDLGWEWQETLGRGGDVANAAQDVDLVVVATPDKAINSVAAAISPGPAVVMHLSGALDLAALGSHRAAGLHPLVALTDPVNGAAALRRAWFAVTGDPIASQIAEALSGKWFEVDDSDRTLYHCAAAIGANHLVALLGQVERIADEIGVPREAFMALAQSSLSDVTSFGATTSLTGPASRGDEATIEGHRAALANRLPEELDGYDSMLGLARTLIAQRDAQSE